VGEKKIGWDGQRTKTRVMLDRNRAMPVELVEVEPEGVEAYRRRSVDTGQTEDKCHREVEVVAIHDSLSMNIRARWKESVSCMRMFKVTQDLGGSPQGDVPARSIAVE
jgi:hypothetical protein